jgi:DNA mismatch repair protein MutS
VVGPDCDPDFEFDGMLTEHDPEAFAAAAARETLREHVGTPDALLESESEVRACGGLLAYVEYTQGGGDGDLGHVDRVRRYDPREYLGLDRTALRSLEVFENREGGDEHTLFGVLGDTASALGRRELTEWLRHPLVREADIEARLDAVEEWTERSLSREEARDALTEVYDLERLLTRVSRGRANARDLRSLKDTLDAVPQVRAALADANAAKLRSLRESLDELEDVRGLIGRAVESDPPQEVTEGDVIKTGFDEDLDALRETEREGRAWVADLEERERERTGIDSLEVGYNEVHGYYIEVTNPNLDRVPQDYTRRQTLKNSERFYTPELKEREDEILGAAERADSLEYDLFREVRSDVAAAAERISATADALSELDALATLAAAAVQYDYARPEFGDGGIEIRRGRHPVVERVESDFVPNDTDLTEERQAIITGPNMSGKSTYMRQVALICLLAQAGSFVPAAEARLPILDRVFTRVGASDDIAGGQSTFMREMAELTTILHAATADSLILLDEVGRGTSTADGLAIARAVTEFVHDEVGAYTLFATHYHGLTDLAAGLPDLCNLHFGADRRDGGVTFRHEVERGASSSSYGVEVARMAGVPDPVVERAHELLAERAEPGGGGQPTPGAEPSPDDTGDADCTDETGVEANGDGTGSERVTGAEGTSESRGESEDADLPAEVLRRLRGADLARTTPLEALQELDDLKRLVEGTDAEAGVGVEAEAEAEADADD